MHIRFPFRSRRPSGEHLSNQISCLHVLSEAQSDISYGMLMTDRMLMNVSRGTTGQVAVQSVTHNLHVTAQSPAFDPYQHIDSQKTKTHCPYRMVTRATGLLFGCCPEQRHHTYQPPPQQQQLLPHLRAGLKHSPHAAETAASAKCAASQPPGLQPAKACIFKHTNNVPYPYTSGPQKACHT